MTVNENANKGDKAILIIEGPEIKALNLKNLLSDGGHTVQAVTSGADGLLWARKNKPALIISDVATPGINGYQLSMEIKSDEALKDTPVMLLDGMTGPGDMINVLNSLADSYITMPFDTDYLLNKIKSLMEDPVIYENNRADKCIELNYSGKRYAVRSGRGQMINLLLASYEHAVFQNKELNRAHEELKLLNERLESRIREGTAALSAEVSERRRAEDALRESEERLRAIVETASDAIICLDSRGFIYLWNRKAEEMFGHPAVEAVGFDMHDLIVPERYRERARAGLELFWKTGSGPVVGTTLEIIGLRKDGSEFPVELSISAMQIRGGWHSTGIIRDITARKAEKEKLQQRMEELERFKKATIERELRMKELRVRLEKLEKGR
ncbi:MAG: PAS domain S-box protein [Deltaproteobacteria bacterium]|nr:PAS domain S-box protein [Deltaproteobacteria bacterium]